MSIRVWTLALLVSLCVAQQQNPPAEEKSKEPSQEQKQPAPLFGGQLGVKSSSSTKESATLGFNGIDPSGKVEAKMLATHAGAADEAKARALAQLRPSQAALDAFLQEGGLKKK
jgi:hypothetical protein